jgi:transcriptional regulator with XRE-family HTH domain
VPDLSTFAKRLRFAISQKGIPKARLAQSVGVLPPQISNWLAGKYLPSSNNLRLLAKELDAEPDWLLTGEGSQPSAERVAEKAKSLSPGDYVVRIKAMADQVARVAESADEDAKTQLRRILAADLYGALQAEPDKEILDALVRAFVEMAIPRAEVVVKKIAKRRGG